MNAKILITGVALAVMATGAVSAKTMKNSASGGSYAAPSQPVPYGQMDSYMKATPKQRAAMSANGAGADTSATATSGSNMGAGSPPDANGMSTTPTPSGSMSNGSMSSGSMSNGSTPNGIDVERALDHPTDERRRAGDAGSGDTSQVSPSSGLEIGRG